MSTGTETGKGIFAPETRGVVIVAENPVLRTPRVQKSLARLQPPWTFFGFDARGNDIFYCDFDL